MHISKYKINMIVFASLLSSCTVGSKIAGEYTSNHSPYSLILNDDSTFSYQYKFEFAYERAHGTWSKRGKKSVVLNSYIQNRNLSLKVQEYSTDVPESRNGLFLTVDLSMADVNKKYYQCAVFVNDNLLVKRSCDSLTPLFIPKPVNNIFFKLNADERIPTRFLDSLRTEKYILKSLEHTRLNVHIIYNDSLFNYRIFKTENLTLSRKGLKFYSSKDNAQHYLLRKNS